jgi:peptide/nickel transport system substrate-binding protein
MMKFKTRNRFTLPALLSGIALAAVLVPASIHSARAASPLYLTAYQNFHPTGFTRNFNPYNPNAMDFTTGAIYEPLEIISPVTGGHTYPWLATGYAYSNGNKTITVTMRPGVKWSDWQPLTAQDVAFTFNYGKKNPVADQNGLWAGKYLQSVTAQGADKVVFQLTKVNTTLLPYILSSVFIVPQHIWQNVKNPQSYTNPNPVGSGPFTQVTNFGTQEFIYARNPHYWQKVSYDGIKVPQFIDNTGADAARARDELDWAGNFVADIQHTWISKNPTKNHYYFYNTNPIGVWFNNQVYPYSLASFRRALSYAIDRKRISSFAENDYEKAADATGIKYIFPTWYDKSLDAQSTDLSTYNPDKAKSALIKAGFKYQNGQLMDPHGKKVSFTMVVPTGWSDWILALQILTQDFKKIGIDATYKTIDPATWTTKSGMGQLQAQLHWTGYGVTPYYIFYSYMSKESFVPLGTDVNLSGETNWERYTSSQATNLFAQYRTTTDQQKQKQLIYQAEKIQLQDMPYIPIMTGADWYEYTTVHFTGWPTEQNFFVQGSPNDYPSRVMVMTKLQPVK